MSALVSIVTANYNKAEFILETINAVLHQTYTNWEWIISDDASTDNSVEIISAYLVDKRISLLINAENAGGNVRRNQALARARGEYVLFLDADDLLHKDCLANRIMQTKVFPKAGLLVFSMAVFKKQPSDVTGHDWIPSSSAPLKDFLTHKLPWSIMQPFWKKEVLETLNGFDENFHRLQDVDLNTRALLIPGLVYKIVGGKPDCYYRIDEHRKNYNTYTFLSKWTESALLYCDKMSQLVAKEQTRYLVGTIFQTYFQVMHHFKLKQLSTTEFQTLEERLLQSSYMQQLRPLKRQCISLFRFYNLRMPRIPGGNRFLKVLLLL